MLIMIPLLEKNERSVKDTTISTWTPKIQNLAKNPVWQLVNIPGMFEIDLKLQNSGKTNLVKPAEKLLLRKTESL